jgi:glycosyltransferase involved in cell wall biosynthesis
MRGGEKVLEMFCQAFPDAPIWTLLYKEGSVSLAIASHPIHASLLQYCPFAKTKYRHYLPFFPLFAELNRAKADLVISSSHSVAKAMARPNSPNGVHICYIHTPMRYAWDLFGEYFGPERVGWFASNMIYRPILSMLQHYDRWTASRVDVYVANSSYIAERVRNCYGREALILPPPVEIERFMGGERNAEDWYLVFSALVPYKRVDQAIRACAGLGRKLKLVGSGPERAKLEKLAHDCGADVEFMGFVDDDEIADVYSRAKALLFPGVEDFGIVPVEAISAGCPVIAFAKGGILDSMTEQTAMLYHEQTSEALSEAILKFENQTDRFDVSVMREQAAKFSKERFITRFQAIIEDVTSRKVSCP